MKNDKKTPICNEVHGTEYERILNMTDEEAADIIKNMIINYMSFASRGNGKTVTQLRINWALKKAIDALGGGTPDIKPLYDKNGIGPFANKVMDAYNKGLRANNTVYDETQGMPKKPLFLTKNFNTPVNDKLSGLDFELNRFSNIAYEHLGLSPKLLNKEVSVNDKTH